MKIIIVTLGSAGDVHPFFGIAKAMKKRGHEVVLLANSYNEATIQKLGCTFISIGNAQDYADFVEANNPNDDNMEENIVKQQRFMLLDPMKSIYAIIAKEYVPGNTALVCWSWNAGARIAREKLGIPMTTIHLAPMTFRSVLHPPRFGEEKLPDPAPREMITEIYTKIDEFMFRIVGEEINSFRRELELPPIHTFIDWAESPDKIIGVFPSWFAAKQEDWPIQSELTTFPLFDEPEAVLQPELEKFLQSYPFPIVITPGSHFKNAKKTIKIVVKAVKKLSKSAIILTRYPEQLPKKLPPGIAHFSYADFGKLLPRVSLLIHHGGIGTTAQALRAGIPQLIIPWGNDQFDNASRIQQLGVGDEISIKTVNAKTCAHKINSLLQAKTVQLDCEKYKSLLHQTDPLEKTCDHIEYSVSNG